MPAFPDSPLTPSVFLEEWLPEAFAEAGPMPDADGVDVKLGIALQGEGGGEWVVHISDGQVKIAAGPRSEAAFTWVQSVDDWRGALWEGRGGAIGAGSSLFFRPGGLKDAASTGAGPGLGGAPSPKALAAMEALSGLIQLVVTGGDSWQLGLQLGTGDIPDEATTTVSITTEDAAAMQDGSLDPMTAFMSGKIQVQGDMTLMMQMQAIQMQVAQEAESGGGDA